MIDKKEIDHKQVLSWLTKDHGETMHICKQLRSKYGEYLMEKADGADKDRIGAQTGDMSYA